MPSHSSGRVTIRGVAWQQWGAFTVKGAKNTKDSMFCND